MRNIRKNSKDAQVLRIRMPSDPREQLMPKTELIVALDTPDLGSAEGLLKQLKGLSVIYKVGSSLFTLSGPRAVDLVHKYGGKVSWT